MTSFLLLAAFTVAGLFVIYFLVRREIKRSINPHKILSEIENDIHSVLTELNNATERDVSIIEDAIERLKRTVVEADKRIRILEQAGTKKTADDYSALKPRAIPVPEKMPVRVKDTEEPDKGGKEKVLEMYLQGFDASLIAHRLGLPLGEVELIISLLTVEKRTGGGNDI